MHGAGEMSKRRAEIILTLDPIQDDPNKDTTISSLLVRAEEILDLLAQLDETGNHTQMVLSCDLGLYQKVAKVVWSNPPLLRKFLLVPGTWHLGLNLISTLGTRVDASGVVERCILGDVFRGESSAQSSLITGRDRAGARAWNLIAASDIREVWRHYRQQLRDDHSQVMWALENQTTIKSVKYTMDKLGVDMYGGDICGASARLHEYAHRCSTKDELLKWRNDFEQRPCTDDAVAQRRAVLREYLCVRTREDRPSSEMTVDGKTISQFKVPELKQMCKDQNLPRSGTKDVLFARLANAESQAPQPLLDEDDNVVRMSAIEHVDADELQVQAQGAVAEGGAMDRILKSTYRGREPVPRRQSRNDPWCTVTPPRRDPCLFHWPNALCDLECSLQQVQLAMYNWEEHIGDEFMELCEAMNTEVGQAIEVVWVQVLMERFEKFVHRRREQSETFDFHWTSVELFFTYNRHKRATRQIERLSAAEFNRSLGDLLVIYAGWNRPTCLRFTAAWQTIFTSVTSGSGCEWNDHIRDTVASGEALTVQRTGVAGTAVALDYHLENQLHRWAKASEFLRVHMSSPGLVSTFFTTLGWGSQVVAVWDELLSRGEINEEDHHDDVSETVPTSEADPSDTESEEEDVDIGHTRTRHRKRRPARDRNALRKLAKLHEDIPIFSPELNNVPLHNIVSKVDVKPVALRRRILCGKASAQKRVVQFCDERLPDDASQREFVPDQPANKVKDGTVNSLWAHLKRSDSPSFAQAASLRKAEDVKAAATAPKRVAKLWRKVNAALASLSLPQERYAEVLG